LGVSPPTGVWFLENLIFHPGAVESQVCENLINADPQKAHDLWIGIGIEEEQPASPIQSNPFGRP